MRTGWARAEWESWAGGASAGIFTTEPKPSATRVSATGSKGLDLILRRGFRRVFCWVSLRRKAEGAAPLSPHAQEAPRGLSPEAQQALASPTFSTLLPTVVL